MAHTVTLRVDKETYTMLAKRAKVEHRSLANYIEIAALEHARRTEFVEDEEMREILHNDRLLQRLREGSRHARLKRGRFVA